MTHQELIAAISDMMDKKMDEKLKAYAASTDRKIEAMTAATDQKIEAMTAATDRKIKDMENTMQENFTAFRNELRELKTDVTEIKLRLENEISVNIQRVAEGHLDLSRNLHDAMKPNSEVEMLAIKVGMLETDVRNLKAKIS